VQETKGVVVAAFELQVDTMTTLTINASDINTMFDSISDSSSLEVISAVAFR
jgi:hypothetical protein